MHKNLTIVPTRNVGPIKIVAADFSEEIKVPLATFETPLWFSVARGARISMLCQGVSVRLVQNCMTRSIILQARDVASAEALQKQLYLKRAALKKIAAKTSAFLKLTDWHTQIVGNLLYLRFSFFTGDAAGHNMTTQATEALLKWILQKYPSLRYVSLSGNYCTDKKVSAVNGILGRGKYLIADIIVEDKICRKILRANPEQIVDLNIKKNLIGSILAGSLRSANAHFANILLAFYLATGQDVANIVEGSQGIVHAEIRGRDLYFSVTLPNVIIGTVGRGKELAFAQRNLASLGCLVNRKVGKNAERLAIIVAATVLCGELSLLAALTDQSELMRSHLLLERRKRKRYH